MKVKFKITLTPDDIYAFNNYQNYVATPTGIISIVVGILLGVMGYYRGTIGAGAEIYICLGASLFVILYTPVTLAMKMKNLPKTNPAVLKPLHYDIDETRIHVLQNGQEAELPWTAVYQVRGNAKYVFVYSTRRNAFIIPRAQMENSYEKFKTIAQKALPAFRCKLK